MNINNNTAIKEAAIKQARVREYQNPWYDYNNGEKLLNETIITLKLSKKHYKTAWVLSHMLGYKSLDDYVSYVLIRDIEKEINQGEIDIDVDKLF